MTLDRRSFFSRLLGIGAAAAVAPLVKASEPSPFLPQPRGAVTKRPGFEFVGLLTVEGPCTAGTVTYSVLVEAP